MKKNRSLVISFLLSFSAIAFIIGCGEWKTPDQIIGAAMGVHIYGHFSWPVIYISDGSLNFAYYRNPVTGNRITNATVIVSNETTGLSRTATYDATWRYYTVNDELLHTAGQRVSLTIRTTNETITGSPTSTPNPTYSNLFPATGATVTRPFTISWEVTQGTVEAAYTWVAIYGPSTAETQNYQVVVPVTQKSVNITSSNISATSENFSIYVFGINSMSLSGAKTGSVVYVGGGNTVSNYGITIKGQ